MFCVVSALRRVLRERDFHGRGFSGASIAERYRGLLRVTLLVGGLSIALIGGLTVGSVPAAAAGGAGGAGAGCGGAGGGDAQVGTNGCDISGGGGGGGGGGAGAAGGNGGGGNASAGGAGGAAGTVGIQGTNGSGPGGGGGGGGGASGQTTAGPGPVNIVAPLSGQTGGAGGAGGVAICCGSNPTGGGGGGGGSGGDGLVVTGAAVISNTSTITGGNGGTGGDFGNRDQACANINCRVGTPGNGGDGGAGFVATVTGVVLTNSGTITGGSGGIVGSNGSGGGGNNGNGGAGVSGSGLTINNSGTIAGGPGGNAINFTGGANTLNLETGWALTGNVNVTGSVMFNQTIDVTLSNTITGSGSVIQNGSGTLTLTSNNTYSGSTTINAGTLALSGFGSVSGGVTLATGGTLDISATTNGVRLQSLVGSGGTVTLGGNTLELVNFGVPGLSTFGGAINGSGGLTLQISGETLTGNNGYTGATTIKVGGSLALSGAGSIASSSEVNMFDGDGAVFDISAADGPTVTIKSLTTGSWQFADSTVNLGSNTLVLSNASGTLISSINGSGGLTLNAGTETLTGSNGYTGATTINGGTLALSGGGNIAASGGVITATGAFFDISASAGAATIKSLAGTGGTVTLGSNALTLSNAHGTFGGAINGNGGLTLTAGTETLTGSNGYAGTTIINGGTLALSGGGSIASSAGVSLVTGAFFDVSNSTGGNATITGLDGTGGTVTLGSNTLTLSDPFTSFVGSINGSGGLTLMAGIEELIGSNGYTGATTINGGTLVLGNAGSIASSSGVTIAAGAELDISFSTSPGATIKSLAGTGGTVALGANTLTLSNASGTFGGAINGSGGLTLTGGTETLTGANTYTGDTTINAGTLQIGNGGTTGSIVGDVSDNGIFAINRSDSLTFANAISGTGALHQNGTGTTILSGTNTYTGATTINGGTLALSGASSITSSSGVSLATGAAFDISASTGGGATIKSLAGTGGTVTLGANTLTLSNASGTFGGAINGSGGLTLTGGTETLTGNSSAFSGTVNVNSGRLLIGAGGTLGNGANAFNVNSGGALGGAGTVGGNVAIHAGGVMAAGLSPGTLTISGDLVQDAGAISNFELGQAGFVGGASNDLVKVGGNLSMGGTLNLAAATAGWYRLYDVTGTTSGSYDTVNSGALNATIYNTVPNQLNVLMAGAGQIVQFWDGADATGNGAVNGGTGSWSAANTNWTSQPGAQINDQWRGGVGILAGVAGTITVAGAQNIQGLQFTVDGYSLTGGTLNMTGDPFSDPTKSFITTDAGVTATIGSTIAGAGIGLTKQGGGTLVLTGTNTYTGDTTISGGTLALSGSGSIATSSGVVDDGALDITNVTTPGGATITSLSGSGTVTLGANTLALSNAGGNFSGGIGGSGGLTLTAGTEILSGTNGYTGPTTVDGGLLTVSSSGSITSGVINNASFTDAGQVTGNLVSNTGVALVDTNGTWTGNVTSNALSVINNGTWGGDVAANASTGTITNNKTWNGAVTTNAGTIINALVATWTGNINGNASVITNNGIWNGDIAANTGMITNNTTWTGTVANAGLFNNSAAATVSGLLTNTAGIVNNAGALNGGANFTGGTLTGTGSVTDLTMVGGTFAPGNGTPGSSMTVTGTLALQSAAIYLVQINPTTSSLANVTGTATLGGATVNASFAAGAYAVKQYTILTAAGPGGVSGTFNALVNSNLPSGFKTSLSYDTNNAYLDLALGFALPGTPLNVNQAKVGNALVDFFNRTGGIPPVFGALGPSGLSQVSGETGTGSQQATFGAMTLFMGLMTDPFTAGRGSDAPGAAGYTEEGTLSYAAKRKPSDAFAMFAKASPRVFESRWNVWAAGYGGSQITDGNSTLGSSKATSTIGGVAVGADYWFSPDTIAGFALAGGGTGFSVNGQGSGRSDLFQAGAFVRHTVGAAYITATAAYGWQDITTDRTLTLSGTDKLRAQFNANAYSGRIEGGNRYVMPWMGGVGVTPYAAAQVTAFDLPNYSESVVDGSGSFALSYAAKTVTATRSELGLRTDKSFAVEAGELTLRGRAAWAHDFNTDRSAVATFQTLPGASFIVNGAAVAHDAALTTASAEIKFVNGISLAATFEGEFSDATQSYAGKGVMHYAW